MDWEAFSRFAGLLDKYDIKPLIGVIPDNKDTGLDAGENRNKAFDDPEVYSQWLKTLKDKGWIIAMHGVYHVYTTKMGGLFPMNDFSEFAGVDVHEQLDMIRHGQQCLGDLGIKTDIFMAPGHSFDKNTLRALKRCGFKYITDGYGNEPFERLSFTFLPISYLRSRELKGRNGITTFVVHPPMMEEKEFEEYEKLLDEKRERFCDYAEMLKIPPLKRNRAGDTIEHFMVTAKHYAGKFL
ncbi:MAG: DUF2334 domain-containing protein [Lachnospiraceae bacterium]|nr:DUF2334 domain-containing protein [Lachnospiraceae bacterium]